MRGADLAYQSFSICILIHPSLVIQISGFRPIRHGLARPNSERPNTSNTVNRGIGTKRQRNMMNQTSTGAYTGGAPFRVTARVYRTDQVGRTIASLGVRSQHTTTRLYSMQGTRA